MKTLHPSVRFAVIGLAVFSFAAGASRAADNAPPPPSTVSDPIPPSPPAAPAKPDDTAKEGPSDVTWAMIKDYNYDKRVDFMAGLDQIAKGIDGEIKALNAKRVSMKDEFAKDWDFNMRELETARAYLRSMGNDLGKATESTWNVAKDKVALAWQRVQEAHRNVLRSTTS